MSADLHRLLTRQLRKLRLDTQCPPDAASWSSLLSVIDRAYHEADEDRYTLERSLALSSEEMHALHQRQRSSYETRLRALFSTIQDMVWLKDPEGVYLACNPMFERCFGAKESEIVGKTDYDFVDREIADSFREYDRIAMAKGGPSVNEERVTFADDGHSALLETVKTPMYDESGQLIGVIGIARDITANKAAAEHIRNLAFYDHLTSLPNRRLLMDRLNQALASCARNRRCAALLVIDLDNFKMLNDTLGHDIGDLLLQQVALRLVACVRAGDTVARLGGDEFVVMLEDLSEQEVEAATQTEATGGKILYELNQFYQLLTNAFHNSASIGIVVFNERHQLVDELLKQADIAMYQAKKAGRNTLRFFDPQMQENINARAELEGELRRALENNQFQLYYQVQMDSLQRPVGAESLIRWIHPERGMVSPAEFIPLAEETGLILPIGQWVLETACARLKIWQKEALTRDLVLAVNVSVKQFRQADFVEVVQAIVRHHAIIPSRLKLELTESMLFENIGELIATMNALNEIGVRFSLDDFGTGYSSLQYLKRLPLDQLKIDQSFVRDIATDSSDRAIVRTIIAMAHSLNLDVIAEGVETEGQRQLLLEKGCTHFQGYLFGRPMPVGQFEALLRQG